LIGNQLAKINFIICINLQKLKILKMSLKNVE
jgi:hypothetical protein